MMNQSSDYKVKFQSINASPIEHNLWDELLQRHVATNGDVDYKGLMIDVSALDEYLTLLSTHPPHSGWSSTEQLTYWINAYNAYTVKLILNHWPVKSIKEIAGQVPMVNSPWDLKFFKIGTIDFDLNTIEHDILRKEFSEPRIHFAINCASESCPILTNRAYSADRINQQLIEQTKAFLSDNSKNRFMEDELELSPIFKWYSDDFGSKAELIKFLDQHTEQTISEGQITYTDYDWNLNSNH